MFLDRKEIKRKPKILASLFTNIPKGVNIRTTFGHAFSGPNQRRGGTPPLFYPQEIL